MTYGPNFSSQPFIRDPRQEGLEAKHRESKCIFPKPSCIWDVKYVLASLPQLPHASQSPVSWGLPHSVTHYLGTSRPATTVLKTRHKLTEWILLNLTAPTDATEGNMYKTLESKICKIYHILSFNHLIPHCMKTFSNISLSHWELIHHPSCIK